jgi:hypothetical protein
VLGGDSIRAGTARAIPGTFGEPLQTVATFPGVAPMASGLSYFYSRGAPPADTGYFLDGIPLPTLFHLGPGPAVVPSPLLDRVDFYPAMAPTRFGRFAGGTIAAATRPPSAAARAEASARLFDSSALLEAPLGPDTTALVAGRYGYPNALLSVFAPTLSIDYWDYTVRVSHALTAHDAVSVLALGGYDYEYDSAQDVIPVSTEFHRVDLRYDHATAHGTVRLAVTFGYDRTSHQESATSTEYVTSTNARMRLEMRERLSNAVEVWTGADANGARYDYDFVGPDRDTQPLHSEQFAGAYVDLAIHPIPRLALLPGVRIDGYRSADGLSAAVDPRMATRLEIATPLTWVSTFGIAHQEPSYVVPVPGLRVDPSGGFQTAYQMSEGAEVKLPSDLTASLTGYYDGQRAMSDFVSECGTSVAFCAGVARVDGRSFGVELLLRRALTQRFSGWLSYTLSRTERFLGRDTYLSLFDRTHVFSGVALYEFGGGVRAGVRATYYSGRPFLRAPVGLSAAEQLESGLPPGTTQTRLPDFFRLDLRAEKRWTLGDHSWLSLVLEVFNATLSKEAVDLRCDALGITCTPRYLGPITLPSLGIEGGY